MENGFVIPKWATNAQGYIDALRRAGDTLPPEDIRDGIDMLSEKRIAEILEAESEYPANGAVYYVSADGDDDNDGRSPEKAWRTLEKASEAGRYEIGDTVLFRRGDVFRGELRIHCGVTYSAYGEGRKPRLYGWDKNSADPSLWKETDVENVWEYTESIENDIGNMVFDEGKQWARKVIKSFEEDGRSLDFRAKREFYTYKDLCENMTFWHDNDSGVLYLRCEVGNPGECFYEIEMGQRRRIMLNGSTPHHVTIDNLCVMHTGYHGIGVGNARGLTIRNCEFGWIGGSIQMGLVWNRTWPTPFGNAIEIYGEAKDFTVDNNYVHDVYDAAATHQFSRDSNYPRIFNYNVRYSNNVFERCVYGVEIFIGGIEGTERRNDVVTIENNILRMGGGFGHEQRPDENVTALIRNGATTINTTAYVVRNNILDRSKTRLITADDDGASLAEYFGNIYVQKKGTELLSRYSESFEASREGESVLVGRGHEHDALMIFTDELGY